MLGNSYPTGNPLSQNHVQAVNNLNSMGMMNDMNSNDAAPFDINDFPQLSSRPNSAGGPQGQLGNLSAYIFFSKFFSCGLLQSPLLFLNLIISGSLRKQGLGVSPIVQQNQEFSIQNEDFPALPGFKGDKIDTLTHGWTFQP